MSVNLKQSVKCPKCSQMNDVTVWSSITAKDSVDLKNDLLMGKINMFHCPSCEFTALMPHPMLYHDEDKKLMIMLTGAGVSIVIITMSVYSIIKNTNEMKKITENKNELGNL